MMQRTLPLLIAILGWSAARVWVDARDATFMSNSGASFCDLVEAVLAKIEGSAVFDNDNGMLRRVAYASAPRTFGMGPWGATSEMLVATQASNTSNTSADFAALNGVRTAILSSSRLRNEFGQALDWQAVTATQLGLPFYSGLTVRLYLHLLQARTPATAFLPVRVDAQGAIWSEHLIKNATTDTPFSAQERTTLSAQFINSTRQFDDQCACNANIDLALVVDGSGSVGSTRFGISTTFAANIAASFDVGPNTTRVALVRYSTLPTVIFKFDDSANADSATVEQDIKKTRYTGGGTRTDLAIALVIDKIFELDDADLTTPPPATTVAPTTMTTAAAATTTPAGNVPDIFGPGPGDLDPETTQATSNPITTTSAPPTVRPIISVRPKVCVLLTDGKSNWPVGVQANRSHALGITMFALGVGNFDRDELNEIASDPDLAHVYTVGDFSVIDNIRTSIRDRSCRTPAEVPIDQPIGGILKENETQFVAVPLPPDEPPVVTITLESVAGDLGFYASFDFPNPSAALNDFEATVSSGESNQFVLTDETGVSTNGRRRRATSDQSSSIHMTVVGRSGSTQFTLLAQSGNLVMGSTAAALPYATLQTALLLASFALLLVGRLL